METIIFRKKTCREYTVILSPLRTDEDALMLYTKWMNDRETIKYLGRGHKTTTVDQEAVWLDKQVNNDNLSFNIVIHDKTGKDILIGNCSVLPRRDATHSGIIGMCIGETEYRGKHIGTTALEMLVDFAFNELNLNSLDLTVSSENEAGIKCYTNVGFKTSGVMRNRFFYEGTYYDMLYMDLMKNEYFV